MKSEEIIKLIETVQSLSDNLCCQEFNEDRQRAAAILDNARGELMELLPRNHKIWAELL